MKTFAVLADPVGTYLPGILTFVTWMECRGHMLDLVQDRIILLLIIIVILIIIIIQILIITIGYGKNHEIKRR